MEARLVTSSHQYVVPQVREVAASERRQPAQRPLTQRERVAASLLACPDRSGPVGAKRL
jgi:hypothetical protein